MISEWLLTARTAARFCSVDDVSTEGCSKQHRKGAVAGSQNFSEDREEGGKEKCRMKTREKRQQGRGGPRKFPTAFPVGPTDFLPLAPLQMLQSSIYIYIVYISAVVELASFQEYLPALPGAARTLYRGSGGVKRGRLAG